MPDSHTIVLDRLEQLEALREDWSALWQRCEYATPFQAPEWLLPWWRAFHPGRLCALALRQGHRLSGLAPLYRDHAGAVRLIGAGNTDFLDVLLETGLDPAAIFDHATNSGERAEFQDLPPQSPLLKAPPGEVIDADPCPVLPLPVRAIPRGLGRNARRYGERLGGAYETTTNPRTLNALIDLHTARWRGLRESPGVLESPAVQAFHRAAVPALAAKCLARFHVLRTADRIAAVIYSLEARGKSYLYISGFDPRLARYNPGTILLAHVIEHLSAAGFEEVHFLRGPETYKYAWGAKDRINHTVLL